MEATISLSNSSFGFVAVVDIVGAAVSVIMFVAAAAAAAGAAAAAVDDDTDIKGFFALAMDVLVVAVAFVAAFFLLLYSVILKLKSKPIFNSLDILLGVSIFLILL